MSNFFTYLFSSVLIVCVKRMFCRNCLHIFAVICDLADACRQDDAYGRAQSTENESKRMLCGLGWPRYSELQAG